MEDERHGRRTGKGPDCFDLFVALAVIILGVLVFAGSFWIALGSGYDRIGPRFFPLAVAAGLCLSGAFLTRTVVRASATAVARTPHPTSRGSVIILCLALVASAALLNPLGFVPSSALVFWLVARSFGSDRRLRDAVVGLLLSVTVYFVFTRGLGLTLPKGLLAGLF